MMPEIQTFLLAMTPLGELRLAIPMGLTFYKLDPATVYFFSVLGNLFAVFLVQSFLSIISRWNFFNRFFSWLFNRTRKKHYDKVNKYGPYFLFLFVAIPLPVTGGWTASLIAFVFGMPLKKAFALISLGVLVAGLIVLFLTRAGLSIEKNFGWQMLIGIMLISAIVYWLLYKKNKNNNKNL